MKKRRLFDEQGRIFGVISVVDILAVLVVAALGLMLYMRFAPAGDSGSGLQGGAGGADALLRCEFLLSGQSDYVADAIEVGDELYFPGSDTLLGRVTGKRTEAYMQVTSTLDGQVVKMPTEDLVDIYITVESAGVVADGQCYLKGNQVLLKNTTVSFETRYIGFSAVLKSCTYEVTG